MPCLWDPRQMCSKWNPGCTSPARLLPQVRTPAPSCQIHCRVSQTTRAARKNFVQLSTESVSWDCCGGHQAESEARGSYTAYLPVFLNLVWDGEGREIMRQVQRKIFFCPELLKKAEWLGCKKRYDIKEKREMWLLFQNLVLNFHTDLIRQAPTGISGYLLNQEWSSWIRNCRLGIL